MRKKAVKLTLEEWVDKKSKSARRSWRARAIKIGYDLDKVPTRKEIREWLLSQEVDGKFIDYIANAEVNINSVELDHKVSVSRGGSFSLDNVGITCRYHNNIKGTMNIEEYLELIYLISRWEDNGADICRRLLASNRIYRR